MPEKQPTCAWCGSVMETVGRGRPKKYCSPSCRQRAYEQRKGITHTPPGEDAVVLNRQKVEDLRDNLFALRCAAEDISTAAREGAQGAEMDELCSELVSLARKVERL